MAIQALVCCKLASGFGIQVANWASRLVAAPSRRGSRSEVGIILMPQCSRRAAFGFPASVWVGRAQLRSFTNSTHGVRAGLLDSVLSAWRLGNLAPAYVDDGTFVSSKFTTYQVAAQQRRLPSSVRSQNSMAPTRLPNGSELAMLSSGARLVL